MYKDKRTHKRFKVKEDVFVTSNQDYSLGRIRDISKGGFSFEYVCVDGDNQKNTCKNLIMSLWTPINSFSLNNIFCKVVYDRRLDNLYVQDDFEERICGVVFLYTDDSIINALEKVKKKEFF